MKRIILMATTLVIGGCAAQPPLRQTTTYVPASVIDSQRKAADVGPDPIMTLPREIRLAYEQPHPPIVRDGITTIYPYNPHVQPMINCAMLRVTEIVLADAETVKLDDIGIGDSERWAIKVSGNRVLVKPKLPGIATDLVVVTNLRSYHFALRTHSPYQPQVAFYFPDDITVEENRHRELMQAAQAQVHAEERSSSQPLNFGYRIEGPDVVWKPLLAFDDRAHLYIQFPQNISGTDMPTLMSQQGGQQETVNYTVRGQYYVVDRLLPAAVLTSGTGAKRQAVQITASR